MRVGGRGTMDETERPREPSPNHREEDSEPSASAIAQDATFYAAMRRAIEKGLERAPIGVAVAPARSARSLSRLGRRGLNLAVMPSPRQRARPQQDPHHPRKPWSELPSGPRLNANV